VIDKNMVVSTGDGSSVFLGELPVATAAEVKFSSHFHIDGDKDLALGAVLYYDDAYMCSAAIEKAGSDQLNIAHMPTASSSWWGNLVLYNPSNKLRSDSGIDESCKIAFTTGLEDQRVSVSEELDDLRLSAGMSKLVLGKDIPVGTQSFKIESECVIAGMEFMGSGTGMGCLSLMGTGSKLGVFAPVQTTTDLNRWSGIALLNYDPVKKAEGTLVAYDASGKKLAEENFSLGAASRMVGLVVNLFTQDISSVATIRFFSDTELTGLIINNVDSEVNGVDGKQVDILPALKIEPTGSLY
jgi:hypothetical protein